MNLMTCVVIFMAGGFFVPVVFRLLWYWVDRSTFFSASVQYYMQNVMLVFWPTSVINMGGADDDILSWHLFLVSLVSNVLVYGFLGLLVGYSLKQCRWVLLLLSAVLIVFWWWMLTI